MSFSPQPRAVSSCACGDHAWTAATKGYVAIVSTDDAHLLRSGRWHAWTKKPAKNGNIYVKIMRGKDRLPLGRAVLGSDGIVDHINGNSCDCRRSNLRSASIIENARNRRTKRSALGLKGVQPTYRKWNAYIRTNGRSIYLGSFDTSRDAADAYDRAAIELWGEFAATNAKTRRAA